MAKKVYITEGQYHDIVKNKKNKKQDNIMACVKASRKARREESRDIYGDGFKSNTHITKTEKVYSRKGKNKFKGDIYDDEDFY